MKLHVSDASDSGLRHILTLRIFDKNYPPCYFWRSVFGSGSMHDFTPGKGHNATILCDKIPKCIHLL